MQREAEAHGVHARLLDLLGDDRIEAEVRHTAATEALRGVDGQESVLAGTHEHVAIHDAVALPPLAMGDRLALEKLAEAAPELFVVTGVDRSLHRYAR